MKKIFILLIIMAAVLAPTLIGAEEVGPSLIGAEGANLPDGKFLLQLFFSKPLKPGDQIFITMSETGLRVTTERPAEEKQQNDVTDKKRAE